jgi:hypothetical protein
MNINNDNYKQFTVFILLLVGISATITYAISAVLQKYGIIIPWYVETPSIPAIYALLFYIFNRFLWKRNLFRKLDIVVADDLNGKWNGFVKSSYDNFQKEIPIELQIEQSATRVKIYGKFGKSKSVSVHENFSRSEIDNKVALFYFFRNEPNYDAAETMATHEGAVKLTYSKEENKMTGYYYSGRDRNNHGTIEVKKV